MKIVFLLLLLAAWSVMTAEEISLTDPGRLELMNIQAEAATHHGTKAVKLTEKGNEPEAKNLAIVKNAKFHNGTIELDVSGTPAAGASGDARGFIGVAFRLQPDGAHYELFYIRPTNGRADDQLRRNHAIQYDSFPDWPWSRLRKESPGVYESYADMLPGEWTHLRVVVRGTNASLYVGKAEQPSLIVRDLKLGDVEGGLALWIGPGTEGYFRGLKVSSE